MSRIAVTLLTSYKAGLTSPQSCLYSPMQPFSLSLQPHQQKKGIKEEKTA